MARPTKIYAMFHSKELFKKLLETASDAIVIVDSKGEILFINDQTEKVFSYSREELIGEPLELLIPERYRDQHIKHRFHYFCDPQQRMMASNLELFARRKDGSEIPVEISLGPLKTDKRLIILATIRDITVRKNNEEEKLQLEKKLQQALKLEAIGVLAGGIAHDFNNILAAILGYTEMALQDLPEGSQCKPDLEEVLVATNRAKSLVKQILTFSQKIDAERKLIQIQPVVKEVLRFLRASLPTTIEIAQKLDKTTGQVLADPTQIHQVIMNLCANASHAMRSEGGKLSVTLDSVEFKTAATVSDTILPAGNYVRIIVSDTGHGMDQATISRIFEPFFTTKSIDEGTGMGLSVVHGIVKNHKGAISVHSKLGGGTIFKIYFPRITDDVVKKIEFFEPLPTGNERILFVDDEQTLADLGKKLLERMGYHVYSVSSSPDALEAFRKQPDSFDLLVTDLTMPNITGIELSNKMIALRPDLPIILITGFGEVMSKREAKGLGIRDCLMKPLSALELGKSIRKVLDEQQSEEM